MNPATMYCSLSADMKGQLVCATSECVQNVILFSHRLESMLR